MWREFLKFANSGAVGTAAHYIVLWFLVDLGRINPVLGSAMGALTGACVNYWLNYHWTFGSCLPHSQTLPRFMVIAAFSLALNTCLMAMLTVWETLHYMVAQIAATLICLAVNYLASRCWAFRSSTE